MINVEYTTTSDETAQATLDFLLNRPILSISLFIMKCACVLLCLGFIVALATKTAQPQNFASVLSALLWIFNYKKINRWLIRKNFAKRKINLLANKFQIDQNSIACNLQNHTLLDVQWKKLKYVLRNKDGYIIPLTGLSNAGKFMWLPTRGFQNKAMEQEFLNLVANFKLKLKKLT